MLVVRRCATTCNPNLQVIAVARQEEATSKQKEKAACVRMDTSRFPSIERSPFAKLLRWYRNSSLRLFLSEIRNLTHRMELTREIRAVERGRGKDSIRQWRDQSLIPLAYKGAYMLHMQQMEVRHPFLSIFDWLLLSRSWKAGLEYGIHIGKLQIQERSCDQFSQVPDTGTDTGSHSGRHAQR